MKISIVTVCYNSEATVRDTIESVLSQTYPNIEYIIIDAASNDSTMTIIDEYNGRITKVISEPDKGIYDAMNKGIMLATGDFVGILNSDDYYEYADAVKDVVECLNTVPSADLIFGNVVFVKPNNLKQIVRFYSSGHFRPWKLRFGWMPPHPATFIRKNVYERVGLYSIDYKIAADYEMFVRMLLVHQLSFARVDKVLVRMRAGGVSTSGIKSSISLNSEIVRACRINGVYTNLPMLLSKIPFKLFELIKKPAEN